MLGVDLIDIDFKDSVMIGVKIVMVKIFGMNIEGVLINELVGIDFNDMD